MVFIGMNGMIFLAVEPVETSQLVFIGMSGMIFLAVEPVETSQLDFIGMIGVSGMCGMNLLVSWSVSR